MPLCPPPNDFRSIASFVSRARALRRIGYAVALGAVLILPSALHHDRGPKWLAVVQPCPAPGEVVNLFPDGTVPLNLGKDTKGPRPYPSQQKPKGDPPACNPSYAKPIGGYCWLVLGDAPPCPPATETFDGKCLAPVGATASLPTSIGR